MPMPQFSLLDEARMRHPGESDLVCIERVAAQVIEDLDEEPPISLEVVASYRDIAKVLTVPMPFAGSLTPEPSGLVIRLNASDGLPRRRFSGFHEVGHTFQPGYLQQTLFRCTARAPRPPTPTDPEDLADAAAAELLLPQRFFQPDLRWAGPGWAGVIDLADRYEASLHSTALRAVRFAPEPTLLVVLEPGVRKSERGRMDARPKLRVVSSRSPGGFPFIPRNKSATPTSPLVRAWMGEEVDERSTLRDLDLDDDQPLHVSARAFPYIDAHGEAHDRVMALYRRPIRTST